MRIEQLTKAEYERAIPEWHQRAMNDPAVHPFLSTSSWRGLEDAPMNDWDRAIFMDAERHGMLVLRMDREASSAGIGLWVLGGDSAVAARLMRFAILSAPTRYGLRSISFCIQENNAQWLDRAMRSAGRWRWGIEPNGAHDVATGRRVALHHFKVPVDEIREHRTVGTRAVMPKEKA